MIMGFLDDMLEDAMQHALLQIVLILDWKHLRFVLVELL